MKKMIDKTKTNINKDAADLLLPLVKLFRTRLEQYRKYLIDGKERCIECSMTPGTMKRP